MKILLLTQHFYPENFIINDLTKALIEKNINFTIFTGKPNYPKGEILNKYKKKGLINKSFYNSDINYLPLLPRKNGSLTNLFKNYFSYMFSSIFFLNKLVKKNEFDYIFVYQTSPILVALPGIIFKKKLKIPLFIWVQDLWPENIYATNKIKKNFIIDFFLKNICKKIYQSADLLLLQSKNFSKILLKYNIHQNRMKFLPNFYNPTKTSHLPKQIIKIKNQISQSKFPIIFAGNIGVLQSLYTIIDASILINDNIDIFLIGEGSEKKNLIKYKKKKKATKINFINFIEKKFIDDVLSISKFLILSYLDDPSLNLTIPSKFQNYLYLGRPILASMSGTTAEIIKRNKLGIVSKPEDHFDLANNINYAYKLSKKDLSLYSNNCKKYYDDNYSQEIVIHKLKNIFETYNNK